MAKSDQELYPLHYMTEAEKADPGLFFRRLLHKTIIWRRHDPATMDTYERAYNWLRDLEGK